MRILGSNDVQIPGQTILWLIARASELNRLNGLDVKKLFAETPSRGFNTIASANPGVLDGINVKSLLSLLNLSDEYISYSCFNFYFPIPEHRHYEQHIRLCSICARQGMHLTLHQVSFWTKCPLHKVKLINTCLNCGHLLEEFILHVNNTDDVYNPYKCRDCGHIQIKLHVHNPKLKIKRLYELLSDYETWSKKVRKANRKLIPFYSDTPSVTTIHGSPYLITRPDWVDQCLTHQPKPIVYMLEPEDGHEWKRGQDNDHIGIDILNVCADIVLNYANVYKDFLRELFCISEDTLWHTIPERTSSFCQLKSDKYSIWAEAYFYLENYIKSYQVEIDKIAYLNWRFSQYGLSGNAGLLSSWLNGPVRVALEYFYTKKEHQSKLLLVLSKYWVRNHLYSQYCNYLGNIITQDLSRDWFYRHSDLDRSMLWTPDTNTYLFYMHKRKAVLEVFPSNMAVNQLKKVYNDGFVASYQFDKSKTVNEQIKQITSYITLSRPSRERVMRALEYRRKM